MRLAPRDWARLLRVMVAAGGVALAASVLTACGSDGNITVGVAVKTPIPEPTLTPVPRSTSTPTNTVVRSPTVTPTNTPQPSDCCSEHPTFGCDNPVCEACVCDVDDFCCGSVVDSEWDGSCVEITASDCFDACPCQ